MGIQLKYFLCILLSFFISGAVFTQTEFSSKGYDKLRIENEYKLAVPETIAKQLWDYLYKQYISDTTNLKNLKNCFKSKMAEDEFIDQYFDNEEMLLIKNKNGIRHRSRIVKSDSSDRKNGRELMQIKINNIAKDNNLERGELKYKIKHYKEEKEELDSHPFLGIVKRDQREELISRLKEYDIDAMKIFPTIIVKQERHRIYILCDTLPYATITLDSVTGIYNEKKCHFIELELELNEVAFTDNDENSRAEMERINQAIKDDISSHFPEIKQDQTPKYNKAFNALNLKKFEYNKPFINKMGINLPVGFILVFLLAASVLLYLNYRRKHRAKI